MSHASDIDIIELVAGRLAPDHQRAVEAHLEGCEECRQRRDAVAQTWQRLGEWHVDAAGHDVEAAVLAAAQREAIPPNLWRRRASAALRLAAAVVLGAGVGHLAARAARRAPDTQAVVDEADARAASQALALSVLEQPAAAGLAEAVLGVPPAADKESL